MARTQRSRHFRVPQVHKRSVHCCFHAFECLHDPARLPDLNLTGNRLRPKAKLNSLVTGRGVSEARGHVVLLIVYPNPRTDTVAVSGVALQSEHKPAGLALADLRPKLGWIVDGGEDQVHPTVAIENGEGGAPAAVLPQARRPTPVPPDPSNYPRG